MEKITPTLHPLVSECEQNIGVIAHKGAGVALREVDNDKIVLVVGQFQQRLTEILPHLKCLLVNNPADAEKVIAEVKRVYRKAPVAIIYRYNCGFETGFSQWEDYFKMNPSLRGVPFFLFTESISENIRLLKRKHNYIDDVITRDSMKNLLNRIEFIGKFKRMELAPQETTAAAPTAPIRKGKWTSYLLKRTFDITASSCLLLAASPIMIIIAVLIKLESKGSIFYASPRAGKNYKIFKFYKFRTMVANADKQLSQLQHLNQYEGDDKGAAFFKVANDPRVTRLGSFLRNSSLDEIPQLFNVIKGDMSLVGNRPLPLYEAASLTTDDWAERFLAPAGITGLWQVSKRGKKEMSAQERIELDINYAHRNSFRYDMWLIMNTPKALIQKDNV